MEFDLFKKTIKDLSDDKLYLLLKSKIKLRENKEFCKVNTPDNLNKMIIHIRDEFHTRGIPVKKLFNNEWIKVTNIPELDNRMVAVYNDNFEMNGLGIY